MFLKSQNTENEFTETNTLSNSWIRPCRIFRWINSCYSYLFEGTKSIIIQYTNVRLITQQSGRTKMLINSSLNLSRGYFTLSLTFLNTKWKGIWCSICFVCPLLMVDEIELHVWYSVMCGLFFFYSARWYFFLRIMKIKASVIKRNNNLNNKQEHGWFI